MATSTEKRALHGRERPRQHEAVPLVALHGRNWHTERWLHEIASFDFTLNFESGKSLLAEDILGRVCEYQTDPNMRDDSSLDERERCFLGQALERRIDQLVLSARDKAMLKEEATEKACMYDNVASVSKALPARAGSTEAWKRRVRNRGASRG